MPRYEFCPSCYEYKTLEQFFGGPEAVWNTGDLESVALTCGECRDGRKAPRDPFTASLGSEDRRILKHALSGMTQKEIARAVDRSPDYIHKTLAGKRKPEVRRAYQMLLEREGLTYFQLARQLQALLSSIEPKWNSATEEWDYFPNDRVRLSAIQTVQKVLEIDAAPKEVKGADAGKTTINIMTNLDSPREIVVEGEPEGDDRTLTIEATPGE